MSEGYELERLATHLVAVGQAGAAYETSHTEVVAPLAPMILMGTASGSMKIPDTERSAKPTKVKVAEGITPLAATTEPAGGSGWE